MFQTALIESGVRPFRFARLPLAIALAIHGGAILLVAASTLRAVEEPPEPAMPVRLVLPSALPSGDERSGSAEHPSHRGGTPPAPPVPRRLPVEPRHETHFPIPES